MKVTLANIANECGVTVSTVQRALSGAGGVSEQKRAQIQKVAASMGYRKKMYSSLSNHNYFRIAVVFPDQLGLNRFYGSHLWTGIQKYIDEAQMPITEVVTFRYKSSSLEQKLYLQEIIDGKHGRIDGIVTRGGNSPDFIELFETIEKMHIPVVLAGIDMMPKNRLCCVRSYEKIAGKLAADLFLNFGTLEKHNQIILCGNFLGLNQFNNAQGFESEIWKSNLTPDIIKISTDAEEESSQSIQDAIDRNGNVGAIYACSTRSTILASEAVQKSGKSGKIKVVGSDLFEESIELMLRGEINAIIHNRPVTIAYRAIQTLVNHLLDQRTHVEDTIFIASEVVMRGNLEYCLQDIDGLNHFSDLGKLE